MVSDGLPAPACRLRAHHGAHPLPAAGPPHGCCKRYVWQDYDLCPNFPELNSFLAFWLEKLEGPLHSVTVAHSRLIKPAEIRAAQRRIHRVLH